MTQILLDVPQYYPQTDSRTAHADRMCFSSTMAMGIKYLKPDTLQGSNADDDYLKTVLRFGDTTEAPAQIKAAATYGITAKLYKNGTLQALKDRLQAGLPIPVGFLHHGPVSAPRGGGHWSLLTGLTDTHVILHDPYGELDNVNGGYARIGPFGKDIRYSLANWLPRWTAGGEAWFMDLRVAKEEKAHQKDRPTTTGLRYEPTWNAVEDLAVDFGARWPQVVAAQWALESSWGKHTSGKNNFFGIKDPNGTPAETKEFLSGEWVTLSDERFKDYSSPEACVQDLVRLWYLDYKTYQGVNRALSWQECCHMLKREGYATDPSYPSKLINLIEQNT